MYLNGVYIDVVTRFRGPAIPVTIQHYSSVSIAYKRSSASGRQQTLMEGIGRMELNIEEQRYSLEVSVAAIDFCWRSVSPTIDFH